MRSMGTLELREPQPRLFKPEEYLNLVELGTFENERVELIRGVIVSMSPIGIFHNATVMKLNELLFLAYRKQAWVRTQMTFESHESLPQPDLACVPRTSDYSTAEPCDAFLIVEVADSSLRYDTTTKAELYGIADKLESSYGCSVNAGFIREAADVYEQRGRLKAE